jgi:tRNA nucleotidyltransferase (CCA-adding enzyme)
METPFYEAKPILEKLHNSGFEAFYVGGAVRDYLLKREIGDIDIATSAKPDEIKQIFSKTIDVGAEHGTIIVLNNNRSFEVTTYRIEAGYDDYRRPKSVSFITSLKDDLRRRDFTINAMAMDIDGTIYDYFHGKQHLKEKVIKTVDSPSERFSEDALRMLRAVRFVSQLGFSLYPETKRAIKELVHLLNAISIERKTVEIEKLFRGVHYKAAIQTLIDCKMNNYLPGMTEKEHQLEILASFQLDLLLTREDLWTLITYLIEPTSVEKYLRKWKLPVKLIKIVEKNIRFLMLLQQEKSWTSLLLYDAGSDCALSVERIRSIINEPNVLNENIKVVKDSLHRLPIHNKSQLDITGHDLIEILKKKPGPWVANLISEIEREIVLNKLENERSAIKEWVLKCNQNFEQNY